MLGLARSANHALRCFSISVGGKNWRLIILERLVVDVLVRGGDETLEQRVRLVRFAQKFRMKLARQEKWMVFQFDHFDQFSVGRIAAQNESGFLEFFAVGVVEFVAVAVAFVDDK